MTISPILGQVFFILTVVLIITNMQKCNTDLVVEHDRLVLMTRFELVIPCRLYHVIRFTEQCHVQQLVIKTVLLHDTQHQ